jgi:hypothetical protein
LSATRARRNDKAFGAESRQQLLQEYAETVGDMAAKDAWRHVYRLLLWIDKTTGLAHCYESDKSQPGRAWYARSLAFHDWLSKEFATTPAQLATSIDWLFIRGCERLATVLGRQQEDRARRAEEQRAAYSGREFPLPGEDSEFEGIVSQELKDWLRGTPPPETMRRLTRRLQLYLGQENKRKNLVGEGFEDVLAFLIQQLPTASGRAVKLRQLIQQIPGFGSPPQSEKPKRVDLFVSGPNDRRVLVSAKWSIRADREEQFASDFDVYAKAENLGKNFEYVLVTNEFDAARLKAACEKRKLNSFMFTTIVHVSPQAWLATYGNADSDSAKAVAQYIRDERLVSLEAWLRSL